MKIWYEALSHYALNYCYSERYIQLECLGTGLTSRVYKILSKIDKKYYVSKCINRVDESSRKVI